MKQLLVSNAILEVQKCSDGALLDIYDNLIEDACDENITQEFRDTLNAVARLLYAVVDASPKGPLHRCAECGNKLTEEDLAANDPNVAPDHLMCNGCADY